MTDRQLQLQHFADCYCCVVQRVLDQMGGIKTEEDAMKVLLDPRFNLIPNLPKKEKKILYSHNKGLEALFTRKTVNHEGIHS